MPKCLFRYQWVKLPRTHLPVGKGIMGYWAKLASRAAFRKGRAKYCGYTNDVMPGMWSGGVVGLKSILGVKSRTEALEIMDTLSRFGYIRYTLDEKTKKLEYVVTDWVVKCSGAECMSGAVYATDGYGFLCLPRNITQRLADQHYTFGESDAWLDLWCHTVCQETGNAFSYLAPAVQFGRLGAALTLEALGRRWGWEKTKVWRFFQKNGDAFALHRLPGSYGCLIFNRLYPLDTEASLPTCAEIERIIEKMRICAGNAHIGGSDNARLNKMILWYSRRIIMNNRKLEGRMESVRRSRLLVDRLNDAVSILKAKPVNGHKMYDIIYMTFLGPDKLMHEELLYRLDISARHYYRLRTQAINIIALRLWSAPAGEVDSWLEVLSILENW